MTDGNEFQPNCHAAYADGHRVPVESDRNGEESLHMFCHEFAVNMETSIQMKEFWKKRLATRPAYAGDGFKLKMGIVEMFDFLINKCQNEHLAIRALAYAMNEPELDDILNHWCPAECQKRTGQ